VRKVGWQVWLAVPLSALQIEQSGKVFHIMPSRRSTPPHTKLSGNTKK
jgi:hypothetical protein